MTWVNSLMAGNVTRSNILNGKIKNQRFVFNFTFQNVASGYTLRHLPTNITSAYVKSTIATMFLYLNLNSKEITTIMSTNVTYKSDYTSVIQ